MTAQDVKAALRRRHPGDPQGSMPGQWTCIEEWLGIDLLALNAWSKADVIGYEVKISRSDLRRELLRPGKRALAVGQTTEFYFAVPAGLLTDAEIAYEEPEWEEGDFARIPCPGVATFGNGHRWQPYGGRCARWGGRKQSVVPVPIPEVLAPDRPRRTTHYATCWACGGKGYLEKSRAEREAPTVWVPRDVGLVTISARGCHTVKPSPKRKDPKSIAPTRKQLNDLVRWVSHRPDPRHR